MKPLRQRDGIPRLTLGMTGQRVSFGPSRISGVAQDDHGLLYASGRIRLAETNAGVCL
jgi:hypothetical protein